MAQRVFLGFLRTIDKPLSNMSETELLTIAEFARKIRRHRRTVYNWIKRGLLTRDHGLSITPSGGFLIDWLQYQRHGKEGDISSYERRRRSGSSYRSAARS
jgi:hypothetical protein